MWGEVPPVSPIPVYDCKVMLSHLIRQGDKTSLDSEKKFIQTFLEDDFILAASAAGVNFNRFFVASTY